MSRCGINRPINLQENQHFVSSNSFKVYLKIRFSKELLIQSGITPLFMVEIKYFLVCGWLEV